MSMRATAPAGGRRFWVVVLCFAIANAGIWVGYDRWQKAHRHHLLEVVQFTPGDGANIDGRPTLCWSFNLDVAPAVPNSPPPGRLTPAIPGKWAWTSPRMLTFSPDVDFPRATPIAVTLAAESLRTPEGFGLAKPFAAALHTSGLEVVDIRQVAFDDGDRVIIEMSFDDKVVPADVRQHLSLRGSDGHPINFQPHGEAAGKKVRVITDPITHIFGHNVSPAIELTLSKGLAGSVGPLGLFADFKSRLNVAAELVATSAQAWFPSHTEAFIQVRFNNSVEADAIKQVLSLEPAVPFTLVAGYAGIDLHGAFEPGQRYTIKLAKAPAGVGRKRVPRPATFSVRVPDRTPGLWFERDAGYLGSEGNRTVLAHAVNIPGIRASVIRIYDNNLVTWRNAGRGYGGQDIDAFSRPVAQRDIPLPTHKNENQEIRLSIDDLLPAGESRDGVYRISLSALSHDEPAARWSQSEDDAEEQPAYISYRRGQASTVVTLSDIGLTAKQSHDGITVWATSLRSAKPLAGVHVRLYSDKSQLLGDGVTQSTGLVKIVPLPPAPGEKAAVLIADQLGVAQVHEEPDDGDGASEARRASARQQANPAIPRGLTWLDLRGSEVSRGDADIGGRPYLRHGYEAFVYTDRGVYRPGETVHLRAIVRGPDNALPPRFPVRWQIRRPDLHDWKAQMAEIDADGATSLELPLPPDLPSGRWTAQVGIPGDTGTAPRFFGSIAFDVEDFIPQHMKVKVELDGMANGPGKHAERLALGDDPITAHVQADYLFGRPVTERPASVVARVDPIPFQPAGFSDWAFGDAANTDEALGHAKPLGRRAELPETALDASGHAKWDIDLQRLIEAGEAADGAQLQPELAAGRVRGKSRGKREVALKEAAADYAGPWRLSITGSVMEAGGRAVTASRQIDVDRVPLYIGLRSRGGARQPGVATDFDIQLITPAGTLDTVAASLEIKVYQETWNSSYIYENSHYRYQSTRVLEPIGNLARVVEIANGHGGASITVPSAGYYVLLARDAKTQAFTSMAFYIGYGAWEDNISREDPERLELLIQPIPEKGWFDTATEAILHGDIPGLFGRINRANGPKPGAGRLFVGGQAQVIVRSPFAGQLLLAIENDSVISTQVLEMPASHIAVPIHITEALRPNAYVTATVIRPVDPSAAWTVHRASGVARLLVDNTDRKLSIQLTTPREIRPETSLGVQLRVLDSAGNPVTNAAITVAAVDEGVCQLTNFATPDPFSFFMEHRALAVRTGDLFGQLMPEVARSPKQSAVGGDEGSAFSVKRGSPVGAKRVRPVALVSGVVHTDSLGLTRVDLPTPQFTGQLRVMAVASADAGFGSAEGSVLVRSAILVQSSWPRFAAPADRFSVPLTVFNNLDVGGTANVTVELTEGNNPLRFAADKGSKLILPPIALEANGQATVVFDIIALDCIGTAHARLIGTMNGERFEETMELPVRPPSPAITVGAYAMANPGAPATVEVPAGFLDGTSTFELRVSNLPQLQLPEGLDYLDRYPYGCAEQTTSTLFPLVYLNDIGQQLSPGLFDKARMTDKVQAGMLRLLSMQTSDGGLAMWPGGQEAWPWASVYAAHFLVEAQAAGFEIPPELHDPLFNYVRKLLNQPEKDARNIEVQAYAAFVLARAGKPERAIMARLSEVVRIEETGSARFHLAAAWLAAGRRDLAAELLPQAIPAPRSERELGGNIGSGIRDRAIIVSTLLAVDPEDSRIPDLVLKLADSGRARQWCSTQDVAFSVMAIGRYLRQSKSRVPYESAELLMDGKILAKSEHGKPLVWTAASLDEQMTAVKLAGAAALPPAGTKLQVLITGPAAARANVAWLQSGVQVRPPPAADSGMTIRRRYFDEHGKLLDANRARSGDLVQIELTLHSASALDHVVIEDLLPAGLEIENPRLEGSASHLAVRPHPKKQASADNPIPPNETFNAVRTDMRDDRLILVGSLQGGADVTYTYTARAVTAGKYVMPPVKCECMYDSGINSLFGAGMFEVTPAQAIKVARAAASPHD